MADKKPKIDKLWIVEGNLAGRYVNVVMHGRKWLYLEPKYTGDNPCVDISSVTYACSRGADVQGWSARAYLSEEHWKRAARRDALVRAFRSAFESWSQTRQYTLEGLEAAAKALGIEVKDG